MLPLTLIYLLQTILGAEAQPATSSLSLNQVLNVTSKSLPNPPVFSLPSSTNLTISVALCGSAVNIDTGPRIFVSNDTSIPDPGPEDIGQPNVFELQVNDEGWGTWSGATPEGGFLALSNTGQTPLEIGVSDGNPMHGEMDLYPLLGDTTSNQVLIFSPPFSPPDVTEPTYPNYTLPAANPSFPIGPATPPNFTMFITPTSSISSMPRTACALRAVNAKGSFHQGAADSEGIWLRDSEGWRWQWLVDGLTPLTNYTAYAIQDGLSVSKPINFVTKSASFACPIVHSLPYCPSINYAVPIAPPQGSQHSHDTSTLPSSVSSPFFAVLTNFTTTLLTHPCGRDMYSPLVSCADCQAAYRRWLCTVWFPRCSEAAPTVDSDAQKPLSALMPQPSGALRSPGLPNITSSVDLLLPCLETCTAVDRACPNFLQFKCPIPRFTANQSYGVGFIDTGEEGVEGGGSTGTAQDMFGNVWCNQG